MAKTITCGVSSRDFERAAKEVRKYKAELIIKAQTLVNALADYGVVIARSLLIELGAIDKGNLANSVGAFFDPTTNTGFIRVDCDYAVFVEFGTGTRGAASPYIGDAINKVAYRYGDGTHYVMLSDGRIGWFYPADDGTWKFTEGMPSRPYMFETAQELRRRFIGLAKEVFKQ